jgi:hypothetical protein
VTADEAPGGEAARLVHVSHGALSSAEPVRVPIAARILLVSDKTVRAWADDGLLTPRTVRPRLLLDAERLHTVLRFLDDLRAEGRPMNSGVSTPTSRTTWPARDPEPQGG